MTDSHTGAGPSGSSSRGDFLPTTAYAVLGLLSFGTELSGYELRQLALNSLRFFYWSPAQSQIYRELRRLDELGFVRGRTVAQPDRPDKTAYAVTDEGRAELARWIRDAPVSPPVIKYDSALRVFFGHMTDPEHLRRIVDEHRRHIETELRDLEAIRAALGSDPTLAFPRIVAGWGQHLYGGEVEALAEVDRELMTVVAPSGPVTVPEETISPPPSGRP